MNLTLQRYGAIAAAYQMLAYMVGFGAMLTVFAPLGGMNPAGKLGYLLEKQAIFHAFNTVIYVLFGVALVVLAVALYQRLVPVARSLAQVATTFALIWAGLVIAAGMVSNIGLDAAGALHAGEPAQAVALFAATGAVQEAIGGGIELVGGVWVLLVSLAGLRGRVLGRALHWLGLAVGVAGILTIAPPLKELGAVFGLGQIIWFGWLALLLYRQPPVTPEP